MQPSLITPLVLLFLILTSYSSKSQSYSSQYSDIISLSNVIQTLRNERDVNFFYEGQFPKTRFVANLNYKDFPSTEDFLKTILKDTDVLVFKIKKNTFVLRLKNNNGFVLGSIYDSQDRPLIGSTIQVIDDELGTASDIDGNYFLEVKPGKWILRSRYVGKEFKDAEVNVSPGDTLHLDFHLTDIPHLREIIVVGPRISSSEVIDLVSPATIIHMEDEEPVSFYGATELLQYRIPSFHSTNQTISDGTDHLDPATLRGLGPDQLLVLVNGKRRHQSSLVNVNGTVGRGSVSTDLNAIPISAIEKIEVLKDGASVHYGSDAIAGVINIQLKGNTNFTNFSSKVGLTSVGDGLITSFNGNSGFSLGNKGGFLNLDLSYIKRNAINRSGSYSGIIYGDERDLDPNLRNAFFEKSGFDNERVMSVGASATDNASLFFNSELPLSDQLKLYAFGGYSFRLGISSGFYRFPFEKERQSGIYSDGFAPSLKTNILDRSITIGLKRNIQNWDLDISNTTGQNDINYTVLNSNNASLGLASPSSSRAGGFLYIQNVTNLDLSKKIPGKFPIAIGVGSEFRFENYQQKAGEESSWRDFDNDLPPSESREGGIQMFPGFRPEFATNNLRYNYGFYANAEIDLSEVLFVGLASRFEYYDDFGNNLSWKAYGRFRFNPNLVLKSSFNTGFRAPSMPQTFFNNFTSQVIDSQSGQIGVNVGQFNNESVTARLFGFEPLKAETSANLNISLAARISKALSFSIDAFNIGIKNRIVLSSRLSGDDDARFIPILEANEVFYAQFFTNAIDTRTRGVDFEMHHQSKIGRANIKLSLLANFIETKVKEDANGNKIIKTTNALSNVKDVLFNREEISRFEFVQPASKLILNANLKFKKWMLNWRATRFGKVAYIHPTDGNPAHWVLNNFTNQIESRDQVFSAKIINDFNLQYYFSNKFYISIGGQNVFNQYPDKHTHNANTFNGIFTYSRRVQQFGVRGAYWYTSVSVSL